MSNVRAALGPGTRITALGPVCQSRVLRPCAPPKPVISHRETPSGDFPRVVRFSRWWSTRREDEPNARRKSAARGGGSVRRVAGESNTRLEGSILARTPSGGVRSGVVTLRAKLLAGAWDRWGTKDLRTGSLIH